MLNMGRVMIDGAKRKGEEVGPGLGKEETTALKRAGDSTWPF